MQTPLRPRMGHALISRNVGLLSAAVTAGAGIALLAGLSTPAAAVPFGWWSAPPQASQPRYYQPRQARPSRSARSPSATTTRSEEPAVKKEKKPATTETAEALPAKAKEPLQVVISIDKQQLTLYSGSQPIAHSRVSTGTASHPTPQGVFSVIQKDRWHRSNIYNNAPMFYMQRITWSGVAMHQGVVPNHPASHGCIRLPEAFAKQLWGTTKLGARVIISRGNVVPVALLASEAVHLQAARSGR